MNNQTTQSALSVLRQYQFQIDNTLGESMRKYAYNQANSIKGKTEFSKYYPADPSQYSTSAAYGAVAFLFTPLASIVSVLTVFLSLF